MTKRKHPVVDVLIEKTAFPDRSTGFGLAPLPADPIDEMLEIPHDLAKREKTWPMHMKGGLPGQVWRGRVKRSRGGEKEIQPMELLQPSPLEREADCPHAAECGGCNYRTLSYETELLLKSQQLRALYAEMGYAKEIPFYRSPVVNGYRNKMEYTFGDNEPGGPLTLGLHRPGHFYDILSTPLCQLVPDDFNLIRGAVESFFRKHNTPYYHRAGRSGFLRHLVLRASLSTRELMVNLVTTSQQEFTPLHGDFVAMLLELPTTFSLVSVFRTVNDGVADTVQADGLDLLWGREYLEENIFDLTFRVGPFSFFQPNVPGARNLYAKALEFAGNMRGQTVYDLYSGTGTLAQIAARSAQRVIGVEIVEEAVRKAREAAERNGIANVKFLAADVLAELARLAEAGDAPDVVFLDPPREGVHPKAIAHILAAQSRRIVYISCNPRTHVRDLALFQQGGYTIQNLAAYDQFPRTKHVETVVLMLRT